MFYSNPFLQNFEESPSDNIVSHCRRLDSWILPLWKPQNSVCVIFYVHFMNKGFWLLIAWGLHVKQFWKLCNCKRNVWMLWECWMENMEIWAALSMFLHLCHRIFFVNQFIFSLNDSFVLHVCCSSLFVLPVSHSVFLICGLCWHMYCFIYFKWQQIHNMSLKYF